MYQIIVECVIKYVLAEILTHTNINYYITEIEGDVSIAFRENVSDRYKAYRWQVITVNDGNDIDVILKAVQESKRDKRRPTLIEIKTQISYGCPAKSGTSGESGPGKELFEKFGFTIENVIKNVKQIL